MRSSLAAAIVASLVALSVDTQAQAVVKHSTAIPAQELAPALRALVQERSIQIIYSSQLLADRHTSGAAGDLTLGEALTQLLRGTGLTFRFLDEATVTILPVAPVPTSVPQDAPPRSADSALEEVVVTGSHIRGAEPVGAKVMTVTQEDMRRSGRDRLQDVLEFLPQNFGGVTEDYVGATIGNPARGTEIQLRGLGPGTTLTLINGRRSPGGGSQGGFTDISNIPAAAIERVEILPDGASAIYGSDAIGGVVNIVLRKDFEGPETRARFATSNGAANETTLSQMYGQLWSGGHALLGYQYSERESLVAGDRGRLLGDQRSRGGTDHRREGAQQRGGAPGNILNPAGSVAYAIPGGQDGTQLSAAQLLPGATNFQDTSYMTYLPNQKMHSVFGSASQQFGERVQVAVDARYSTRDVTSFYPSNGVQVSVPSTNPFYVNPFGGTAPVRVEYDFTRDVGVPTTVANNETFAASLAPRIALGAGWELSLSAAYGKDRSRSATQNVVNTTIPAAVLADPNPATALNVFGDGTANNPETLARILRPQSEYGVNTAWSGEAILDGALVQLPAGAMKLAAGIAYHSDHVDFTPSTLNPGETRDFRGDEAVFAEVTLPVIRGLDLSLAGRYDEYSDFGSTFNPKVGLAWRIATAVKLRGTWGTSFRAPPFYLSNLVLRPPGRAAISVVDPASPTGRTNALTLTGSVRDMKEETADLWTAGIDFTPFDGFTASATYFKVLYNGRIGSPIDFNAALVDAGRYDGTGLVIRNPTQAQIDALCNSPDFVNACSGTYGAIIDNRRRNIAVTHQHGIDVELGYRFATRFGDFNTAIDGTYLLGYDEAISPGSPAVDRLDLYQRPLSQRLRGMAGWSRGAWSVNAAVNFTGGYENLTAAGAATVGSWTTLDFSAGYRVAPDHLGWLQNVEVRFSATNAFNTQPPFVDVYSGYDAANANMIGRTLGASVARTW